VAEREVAFLKTPWRGTRVCWHHQKLGRLDQYKGEDVGLYVVALPVMTLPLGIGVLESRGRDMTGVCRVLARCCRSSETRECA
jgi:hypothetical protein